MLRTRITEAAGICSLGDTKESISSNLFNPKGNYLERADEFLLDDSCFVGRVTSSLPKCPDNLDSFDSRFTRLILNLCEQLRPALNELLKKYSRDRIGIVIGSSTTGVDEGEKAFIEKGAGDKLPSYFKYFHQEIGAGSYVISNFFGIAGPSYTISTACSSSAKTFISADMLLNAGICDAVIVGGVDSLCKMTVRGFKSLDLVSNEISNPMSKNRKGLNIGEGGALFIVERSQHGVALLGYGESSDAYHISAPHPEAKGAILAIEQALQKSSKAKSQVKYVNLHGTGTVFNDAMESLAIYKTLGSDILCSSTKPLTGHLLGASGAIEAFFCWLILQNTNSFSMLPPHLWDEEFDPEIPKISLCKKSQSVELSPEDCILSTSFAFGGSNCCLAFGY